jgi:hypothetical protein
LDYVFSVIVSYKSTARASPCINRYIIMYWTNDNFLCRKYLLGAALKTLFKYVKVTSVILFNLAFVFIDKLGMYRFVTVEGAI